MRSFPRVPRLWWRAALWLLGTVPQGALGAERWGGSLALTSDYLLRGITQSDGAPALQADFHYTGLSRWYAGVWASTVQLDSQARTTAEINAYAGYTWPLALDWSGSVSMTHYAYPWNSNASVYRYDELIVGAAFRDLVFVTLAISPDKSREQETPAGKHTAASCDVAFNWPLRRGISLSAGIGRYLLTGAEGGRYWYWNSGVAYDAEPWRLEAGYFGTSDAAWALFESGIPHSHWAATVLWRF